MKRTKAEFLQYLFLLLAIPPLTLCADSLRPRVKNGHLVENSRDFYQAIQNKSNTLLYVDGTVQVRNYYGWEFRKDHSPWNGAIVVDAYPLRYAFEGRPKIDLDGYSMHQLMSKRRTLTTQGMHYLNVHLPFATDMAHVPTSSVVMKDCIVEVFIKDNVRSIKSGVKYIRSLMEDPSGLPHKAGTRVTHWWCQRNLNIDCRFGGILLKNHTIPWTSKHSWQLNDVVLTFVPRIEARVAISQMFSRALKTVSHIEIPYDLTLNYGVCNGFPISQNITIYDPKRSIPPVRSITFDRRLYGCVEVSEVGTQIIRVTDLILRDIFVDDTWPLLFPFLNAREGTTIVLENVIIEMDTPMTFRNATLPRMAKLIRNRKRPVGLGTGQQKIAAWKPEDCETYLNARHACSKQSLSPHDMACAFTRVVESCPAEAKCPYGAVFIEDASFTIQKGDGNNDLGIGVQYHVRHSLVTVIPPHGGFVDALSSEPVEAHVDPSHVSPTKTKVAVAVNRKSSNRHTMLALAIITTSIGAIITVCGYVTYKLSHGKNVGDAPTQELATQYAKKCAGDEARTLLTTDPASEPLGVKVLDTDFWPIQPSPLETYQQAATDLLGSVTLGPLLGAGSFGKVFKATWNGATVAVKVIVHDGISYRGTAAQREALLSAHLHHPNIVQTFVQSTREIKHDEYIPTLSRSQPNHTPVSPVSVPPNEQLNNDGYVNLAVIVPDEYRPEPPPRSIGSASELSTHGKSFSGDRIETWLVQEYCDMGSLEKAIRKGKYMKGDRLNIVLVVDTCIDICRGMVYLKDRNIIHGDLKSSNILLHGSLHEDKGFAVKVADFGLSRELAMHASHVQTATTGTVTHMPPELFKEERLTAASDVYSFGIVMWELVSKESPLEGVPHVLIIKKIVYDNWRPTFVEGIPERYASLARRCWAEESKQRPTMDQVLFELMDMKQHFLQQSMSEPSL